MINEWILDNFKSINKETQLEFRPLTIFTGANSSGKSTVLQSILLVTQTIQSHNEQKAVVLNGHIKKFGTYEDIVNMHDDMKNISIGFGLLNNEVLNATKKKVSAKKANEIVKKMECSIEITSDLMLDCVAPLLKNFMCKTTYVGGEESICNVTRRKISEINANDQAIIKSLHGAIPIDYFRHKLTNTHGSISYTSSKRFHGGNILGVGFSHFLPDSLVIVESTLKRFKDYIAYNILPSDYPNANVTAAERKRIIKVIQPTCLEIAEHLINTNGGKDFPMKFSLETLERLKANFTLKLFESILFWYCYDNKDRKKYIEQIWKCIDGMKEHFNVELIRVEMADTNKINSFFNNHIKYLAPLREEPRALYPIGSNGDMTDIGLKGEYTAAVYQNNKSKTIRYIPSASFINGNEIEPKDVKFEEAINDWLHYLGVAEEISTNDQGKFGHELKIHTENGFEQDLTHVGVGVSQVLPILVLCFLAGRGDTIILEQPELHLHPKVQTRLADFFVSMNALGKQCVIETHSEYLINRLRYHVAISEDSKVADETMMYFVEKDHETGGSVYRPVTINKYGVIEDWPEGFFDEGERLAAEILRAGMEKKMQEDDDYEE